MTPVRAVGLTGLLGLAIALPTAATCAQSKADPIVVLLVREPAFEVLGKDEPSFALYADGTAIFADMLEGGYRRAELSVRDKDDLLDSISPRSLLALKNSYGVPEEAVHGSEKLRDFFSDSSRTTTELHIWVGGTRKSVTVHGDIRSSAEYPDPTSDAFARALDAIRTFSSEGRGAPWLPDPFEVLLWPFDVPSAEPAPWPAGWPGLSHATPSGSNDRRRLPLPASEFRKLKALSESLGPLQGVRIEGRIWTLSYRFPFPREELWMR